MRNLKITNKALKFLEKDTQYEEYTLGKVTDSNDSWGLNISDSSWLNIPKTGFTPRVGMVARFYGKGYGYSVRGVTIRHECGGSFTPIYYRTIAESDNDHKRYCEKMKREKERKFKLNKKIMDADYNALPDVFKKRIDGFRKANPNFRRDYEGYEIFTIKEAIKIANALKDPAKVHEFYEKPFEEQAKMVVGLDEGHSGNTFGCACQLARMYLESPETVLKMHGALVPVVGCEAYGCKHEKV